MEPRSFGIYSLHAPKRVNCLTHLWSTACTAPTHATLNLNGESEGEREEGPCHTRDMHAPAHRACKPPHGSGAVGTAVSPTV